MRKLTYQLAEAETGTWRLIFKPDELDLYVEFKRPGVRPKLRDRMSVDDLFAFLSDAMGRMGGATIAG